MTMNKNRRVAIRFVKAYLSLLAMMFFSVAVSILKGSDWKILLVGMPLFAIFFFGISYQLFKELKNLKGKRSDENKNQPR